MDQNNKKGQENCLKRSELHNSFFNCIVNQPSYCNDLVQDGNNLEHYWSAKACEDKNEGSFNYINPILPRKNKLNDKT